MLATLLALSLSLAPSSQGAPEPTDAELRRAHALLSGVWEYVEYVDSGDSIGMELLRRRFARDGHLTIGNRVFETRSPDGGEPSLKGYRINPAAVPMQIDFTTEDDRIQRGIYRFEGDELVLCYAKNDGAPRPDSFASPAGSNLVLARLKIATVDGGSAPKLDETPSIPAPRFGSRAAFDDAPRPTADQLRRDQDLLTGMWKFASLVDDGQSLGAGLIAKSVASGGKLTISNRSVEFVEPDTSRSRVLTYRINPAADPKQLDIINEDGQLFRGIYRFTGNDLVVCLKHRDNGARPIAFSSEAGSDDMLMTFHAADPEPPAALRIEAPTAAATAPESEFRAARPTAARTEEVQDAPRTIKTVAATASDWVPTPTRRPTERELEQAHAVLAGVWDIESVVNNGETYNAALVREKLARDGKVEIGERALRVITPETGERRISAFKINPLTSPRQIDVISSLDRTMPGIYRVEGDELVICLHRGDDAVRPTAFEAPGGSENLLIRLKMASPAPSPEPAPPSPEELRAEKDARVRGMLIGSWVTTDKDGTVTTVLRPDGTYISTRQWRRNRLFKDNQSTTQGRWSYAQGLVKADVRSATDSKMLGRSFAARVQSIGDETMVATDFLGQTKNYRKLR